MNSINSSDLSENIEQKIIEFKKIFDIKIINEKRFYKL